MSRDHPSQPPREGQSNLIEVASRRDFLKLSGVGGGALAAGAMGAPGLLYSAPSRAVSTNARIVIVGAGAAGLAAANRFSRRLDGAEITVIDRREPHYYQPGLTLVATGIWEKGKTEDSNDRYMPNDVRWVKAMVEEYDPENNRLVTDEGDTIEYDYLVVATGLELRFDRIEGMSADLIGTNGIGCVYDTPDNAQRTWDALEPFTREGGKALFVRPPGGIKCAGAPLKMMMITEHRLRQQQTRENSDIKYFVPGDGLFSQPDIEDYLRDHLPNERGIDINWHHQVKAIDPENRRITFDSDEEGEYTEDYDFIHLPPPMSAPKPIRESDLAAKEGPYADGGWLEVDKYTLRHKRYSNVFGAGDVCGVPISKTSASAKNMNPVVVQNIIDDIEGRECSAEYDGYTSCPLITEIGRAILLEFNYDLDMVPTVPLINPYRPHWVGWVMKVEFLQPMYNAVLRGRFA
ncbi:FAD-dependent pyridine nucleotide-disulphide oxidoreductase [Halorhodospira halochloris]|uniref:FAD-dependent pyridine nucleotide-disulphide oxidoreductase n=2 Tax=Chromatiales TaxID=135613 RepID=A0A0X8X9V5_HALHR|nr:FAD-dependent oxidoreductase [Halorhodospira halochloris]MBK1652572.1 pyridine nucleotide-disulfide oxidoreductase [Halorhodospira halochloris]BAU58162.2 FAD-dependent pyridine nucleotide-disulphide oxidoreductase [Halorhodospira halochloris]